MCNICNNNCCNGGYGKWPDGQECTLCPYAYEYQKETETRWMKFVARFLSYRMAYKVYRLIFGHPLDKFFKKQRREALRKMTEEAQALGNYFGSGSAGTSSADTGTGSTTDSTTTSDGGGGAT